MARKKAATFSYKYGNIVRIENKRVVRNGTSLGLNLTKQVKGWTMARVTTVKQSETQVYLILDKIEVELV